MSADIIVLKITDAATVIRSTDTLVTSIGSTVAGPAGPQGSNGAQGSQGTVGAQGAAGSNGSNGAQGATGSQGASGTNGTNGAQGAAGAQGATGSFNANSAFTGPLEQMSIDTSTALSGSNAATVSIKTAGVYSFTTNPTANWTTNIRGDGSTTLASMLAVGQSVTVSLMVANGAAAKYCPSANLQIDGSTSGVTMLWMNGAAPAAGNASSTDIYTYTIVKTAATPTYSVYATLTKFA